MKPTMTRRGLLTRARNVVIIFALLCGISVCVRTGSAVLSLADDRRSSMLLYGPRTIPRNFTRLHSKSIELLMSTENRAPEYFREYKVCYQNMFERDAYEILCTFI